MGDPIREIVLNPVRIRIVQCLLLKKQATAQQIGQELSDVPPASLYRHLKKMTEAGLILVASENRVRGTLERVYELNQQPPMPDDDPRDILRHAANTMLLSLLGDFEQYCRREDFDPVRDLLAIQTCSMLLSDEECQAFLTDIGKIYERYLENAPREDRKVRRIYLISAPDGANE